MESLRLSPLLWAGALLLLSLVFLPIAAVAQDSAGLRPAAQSGMPSGEVLQGVQGQSSSSTPPLDLSALDGANPAKPAPAAVKETGTPSNTTTPETETASGAATDTPTAKPANESGKKVSTGVTTVWELVLAGGWVGVIIFLLSLYACMRVVQFCLAFRRAELMPPDLCREVTQLVETGRLRQAIQCCDDDGSAYGRIVSAAIGQADGGWSAVEQAGQDAMAEEAAGMYRRVEILSVVGNIAPMLGLLGTVLGMVIAFGELATSDGLAKNLAQGIYFALVTTVDGLLVAIPSLLAFSFFNNRVAVLVTELTHRVESTLRPLRRGTQPLPTPRSSTPGVKVSGLQELK